MRHLRSLKRSHDLVQDFFKHRVSNRGEQHNIEFDSLRWDERGSRDATYLEEVKVAPSSFNKRRGVFIS